MKTFAGIAALLLGSMLSASAPAAMFTNGSFESQAQAGPSRVNISNLDDWTSSGGFILLERGINATSGVAASDGDQFLSFGHNGTAGGLISQTFDTVIGESYTVDFTIFSIQGSALQEMTATVFDDMSNTLDSTVSTATLQNVYVAGNSLNFVAVSTSSTLQFQHTLGASFPNLALDDVRVTTQGNVIPEPSSMILFGAAIPGIGALIRRRKNAVA